MSRRTHVTRSVEETQALGEAIGATLSRRRGGGLHRRAGAGKTAFLQGLARGLGVTSAVTSPTFVLVNVYRGRVPVYHLDAYRTASLAEVQDLGFEEMRDGEGVTLIEWADRILPLLPGAHDRRAHPGPGRRAAADRRGGAGGSRVTPEPAAESTARRARVLLLVFAGFVVYGSFFPFSFHLDVDEVQRDLARFWGTLTLFDSRGRRLFSIADLVSNVLLGVPVGVLLVQGRVVGRGLVTRVVGVVAIETLFAGLVEVGQILAPTRTAALLDVLAQAAGALAGALTVHGLGAGAVQRVEARVSAIARGRPALVVAAILAALLAADALYPYALTLDVSTAWGNLRRSQLSPFTTFGRRFWGDILVERVLPYAALHVSVRLALGPGRDRAAAALPAWLLTTGWALALEAAKLCIVGRAPSVDNVILAALGGLLGVLAFAPLAGSAEARARGPARLAWLTGAHLTYRELAPFDWLWSADAVAAKAARIEWIPLASYFHADPQSALFDLVTKLAWSGFFGASLRAAGAPWPWALALGAVLEGLQVVQRSHVPALTDVLTIGAGAALGAAALGRHRRWRTNAAVSIAGH